MSVQKYYIVNLYIYVKVQLRPCLWQIESWPLFGMSWRGFSKTENRDATEQLGIARLRRRCADIIWRDPIGYLQETWRMKDVKICQVKLPIFLTNLSTYSHGWTWSMSSNWTILNYIELMCISMSEQSETIVTACHSDSHSQGARSSKANLEDFRYSPERFFYDSRPSMVGYTGHWRPDGHCVNRIWTKGNKSLVTTHVL